MGSNIEDGMAFLGPTLWKKTFVSPKNAKSCLATNRSSWSLEGKVLSDSWQKLLKKSQRPLEGRM